VIVVVPSEGFRLLLSACPVTRTSHLSRGSLRLRVLYATKYGTRWASSRSALTSAVSGPSSRLSSGRRPPKLSPRVHPLVRFVSSSESPSCHPPVASQRRAPSWGSLPSSRHQSGESTPAGVPSPLRSVLDVSHVLDGFLLHRPCGFVSPRNHVQGSLSRGFPSHTAARAFARRCPLVVSTDPLPTIARERQGPAAAFRAFLRVRVRCGPWGFSPRPTRSPPELLPPSGFSSPTARDDFAPLSARGLSRPSAYQRCATRLALASLPPRSRFPTCRPNFLGSQRRGPSTFSTRCRLQRPVILDSRLPSFPFGVSPPPVHNAQ
jgi:hypothetical protein